MKFPKVIKCLSAVPNNRTASSHQRSKNEELPPPPKNRFGLSARRRRPLKEQYKIIVDRTSSSSRHQRKGVKTDNRNKKKPIEKDDEMGRGEIALSTNTKQDTTRTTTSSTTRQKQPHRNRAARFCSRRHQKKDDTDQLLNRIEKELARKENCHNEQIQQEQKRKLYVPPVLNNDTGSNAVYSTTSSFEAAWASENTVSVKTKEIHDDDDAVNKKSTGKPAHVEKTAGKRPSTTKATKKSLKKTNQQDDESPMGTLFNHLEETHRVATSRPKDKELESNLDNPTLTPKRFRKDSQTDDRSPYRPKHKSPGAKSLSRTPRKADAPTNRSRSVTSAQLTPMRKRNKQKPKSPRPRDLQNQSSIKRKPSTPKQKEKKVVRQVDELKTLRKKKVKSSTKDVPLDESSETSRTERTTSSYSSRTRSRSVSGRTRSRSRRSRSSSKKRSSSSRSRSKSRARSSSRKRSGRKMKVEDARKMLNPTDHPTFLIRPVYSSSEEDSLSQGECSLKKERKSPKSLRSPKRRSKRNSSKERGFIGLSSQNNQTRRGRRPNRQPEEIKTNVDSPTATAYKSPKMSKIFTRYPNPFVKPV